MSGLNQAVEAYLTTRRALGFKLERHGRLLPNLVGYLEHAGVATVTTELALAWATQPEGHPDESAKRLSVARGFAHYLRTLDPDAEVPPADLLPRHPQPSRPYLYSDSDVVALMAATSHAHSARPAPHQASNQLRLRSLGGSLVFDIESQISSPSGLRGCHHRH